jgi:hypothetical protein
MKADTFTPPANTGRSGIFSIFRDKHHSIGNVMNNEFYASLIYSLIMAFSSAVWMGFYYLAIHRPGLKKIMETGEPPAIWRYGLARYGHTVLSTRIGAVMFLILHAAAYLVTRENGFNEWCGFFGYVYMQSGVMVYADHTLAKAHLNIPIKLIGLSGILEGIALVLAWLIYWHVINVPVKSYFCLNSIAIFITLYVLLAPMRGNTLHSAS